MVHQKHQDANYMVLLTKDFLQEDEPSVSFKSFWSSIIKGV